MQARKQQRNYADLFTTFGVILPSANGTANVKAEACPFCDGDKFYVNVETGQYQCHRANNCGEKGNAYTFIRHVYEVCLGATTDEDYHPLRDDRDLPLQMLKHHGLAWWAGRGCWLIPYKSAEGEVLNLTQYEPTTHRKYALPGLPLRLYGLDRLTDDRARTLFVCEGPWDAIALDGHLKKNKTRARHDVIAVPAANVFKPEWLDHLKGRTVRLCLDNDKAGRDGQEKIARLVRDNKVACDLSALCWPDGTPDKCDLADLIRGGGNVVQFTREHCVKLAAPQRKLTFVRGSDVRIEPTRWFWKNRIPFDTFCSLSGRMGTGKSLFAKWLTAVATTGATLPGCDTAVPAFDVLYLTSEDSASQVCELIALHEGDLDRVHVHDVATAEELVNLVESSDEMEAMINQFGVRLVVVDALNSFAQGIIKTDCDARRTLSGPLQRLARRTGACILGIRNWGKATEGTASQKALGASSLSDVSRCVLNTLEVEGGVNPLYELQFEKVTDARPCKPMPYRIVDASGGDSEKEHLRKIFWEKDKGEAALSGLGKKGSKKG